MADAARHRALAQLHVGHARRSRARLHAAPLRRHVPRRVHLPGAVEHAAVPGSSRSIVAFALALPMAWLVERTDFPGKPIVFTLMTVALLIPGLRGRARLGVPAASAHRPDQPGADVGLFGLSQAPFNIGNIVGMGMVEGLTLTPLTFIMTAVVLRSMDPALEEAAAMSGAKLWQAMLRVTLRVLWPGLPGGLDLRLRHRLRLLRRAGDPRLDQPHLHVLDLRVPPAHPDRRPAGIRQRRRARRDHGGLRGAC